MSEHQICRTVRNGLLAGSVLLLVRLDNFSGQSGERIYLTTPRSELGRIARALAILSAAGLFAATIPAAEALSAVRLGTTVSGQANTAQDTESVAVLPFTNITEAPEDDWIGVGIAESLATDLERASGVSVTAYQTVSAALDRLPAGDRSAADGLAVEAGRLVGARWVVSGGYQRMGDRLRITARLVEVETATVVRAARVDGQESELFALQDRVAADLAGGLSGGGLAVTMTAGERSPEADPTPPRPPVEAARAATGEFTPLASTVVIDGPAPPMAPSTLARDADGGATIRAVRIDAPLRLDGALDDGVYEDVASVSGFIQQVPNNGEAPTELTEVWIFYDDENIYVAARCWDSEPESLVANDMRRDSFTIIRNDNFQVVFDTFYDRRNGVGFMVNPIAGFFDYQITDESSPNSDWNPVWDRRTGRFDGGWTVEMEIPFKSLRYSPGASQVWGIQLQRYVMRMNEWSYLTLLPINAFPGILRLSEAGTLVGLEVPAAGGNLEVKPYAISSVASDLNAAPVISNAGAGDFGIDAKYAVTENLTADFTYNTDFAQVEVDEQQVNLTRFSLFFPEKREFFLESRGIFDFGSGSGFGGGGGGGRPSGGGGFFGGGNAPIVFFSRRIGLESGQTVPILGGGRLTGKIGQFSVGAVNIQTDEAASIGAQSTNFTVLRVKRDILRRSRIGGIFTSRSVSTLGQGSNAVYGLDAAFSFYDNVNFSGYYARTRTPGLVGDDASYQAAFSYNGDLYGVRVDHLLVGDNFNPEIGFLRRDDFRRTFVRAQYSPRPSSIDAVRQFRLSGSVDYILNGAGELETRTSQVSFNSELENSDRIGVDVQKSYELLLDPFQIASDVAIPIGGYGFSDVFLSYSMGGQRRVSGSLSFQRGAFFNGSITAAGYRQGRIEVTPQLSVEPGISVNRIELPEGRFTATLATTRATYTFTPRMFFGGLLQYNSSNDTLSANLRLRWEYSPGSELFVVYTDQRDTMLRGAPVLENRAFIVKINRLFRF